MQQETIENYLKAFQEVLSLPSGEDFFQNILLRLEDLAGASFGMIVTGPTLEGSFKLEACTWETEITFISQCNFLEQENPEPTILQGSDITCLPKEIDVQGTKVVFAIPFYDSLQQVVGALFLGFSHDPEQKELLFSATQAIAPRIAQELERHDTEELMLQAAEEIDLYSSALASLHELLIQPYPNTDMLFQSYLKTGIQIFQAQCGILFELISGGARVKEIERNDMENHASLQKESVLYGSFDFLDNYEKQDIMRSLAIDELNAETNLILYQIGIRSFIACPIVIEGRLRYVLMFCSFEPRQKPYEDYEKDILDLMGKAISFEIERRTAEERVRQLKDRQDGDYFLTSLLLKPLSRNHAKHKNFKVSMVVDQKKKFKFKHWSRDLGGDICVAGNLFLKSREYIYFLNADAMGKSMQGAGGALVLGSVFDAMVKRTKLSESAKNISPERWLKNVWLELQDVFLSFDGSMLVSAIFGLTDVQTGLTYLINAEHPWPVLYRDKVARFVHTDDILRKLGFPEKPKIVRVQLLTLNKDDVLILGSDGRDDLKVKDPWKGTIAMNEDETLFLKTVEKGEGNVKDIFYQLKQTGEITDDTRIQKTLPTLEYLIKQNAKLILMAHIGR
ncbi:MAG: phosphoglycerate kinase, partial [Candidatus Hydrogenedentota bacterium]